MAIKPVEMIEVVRIVIDIARVVRYPGY